MNAEEIYPLKTIIDNRYARRISWSMGKNVVLITLSTILVGIIAVVGYFFFTTKLLTSPTEVNNTNIPIRIGFSLGDLREERWQRDRDYFVAAAEKQGAFVQVMSANSDANLQNDQIKNLISQGVNVIVVAPYDGEKIAEVIPLAHEANIKVIAYDRLIKNSDLDFYISFDNVKVGYMEAQGVAAVKNSGNFAYIGGAPTDNNSKLLKEGSMQVLAPLIKKGSVKLVVDAFMQDWKPEESYKTIKTYLGSGGRLDAIIAANDGTAFGAIRALTELNLQGKIPVSGQDAELSACQRIIQGTQSFTIYKPIPVLADKAAEIAISIAKGEAPLSNNSIDNGKIAVPSFFLNPIVVTKENMEATVIKDGYHTKTEIYSPVK